MVYIPKDFVPHAASLRHTCVHCGRFVTAAPRRSLGSVSVPMWPANLSVRLPINALVSHYLANKLIGRGSLLWRLAPLNATACAIAMLCGISPIFTGLFPTSRKVIHVLRTRSPRAHTLYCYRMLRVRLACVKHAASVRSEPGSNSRLKPDVTTVATRSCHDRNELLNRSVLSSPVKGARLLK